MKLENGTCCDLDNGGMRVYSGHMSFILWPKNFEYTYPKHLLYLSYILYRQVQTDKANTINFYPAFSSSSTKATVSVFLNNKSFNFSALLRSLIKTPLHFLQCLITDI